jgi:MSHA pilin protein MshD
MRTAYHISRLPVAIAQRGVTLVELLVFIVIISIALVGFLSVFGFQVTHSVDPVARVKALEKGQAMLDEVLSRKFANNTPTGGVPACSPCAGIEGYSAGSLLNDVGDYAGYADGDAIYPLSVMVTEAGVDLGIANDQARLVTVTVGVPGSGNLNLSAYRVNF